MTLAGVTFCSMRWLVITPSTWTILCVVILSSFQFSSADQETRNLPIARVRHLPRAIAVGKGGRSLSQPPAITNIFGMPLNTNGALARGVQTI
jgi:hypothetical protein